MSNWESNYSSIREFLTDMFQEQKVLRVIERESILDGPSLSATAAIISWLQNMKQASHLWGDIVAPVGFLLVSFSFTCAPVDKMRRKRKRRKRFVLLGCILTNLRRFFYAFPLGP